MQKRVAVVLFLTVAVRGDSSFVFPDEVSTRYNTNSGYDDGGRNNFNSYGFAENRPFGGNHHYPGNSGNHHHSNNEGFIPGFGNHHSYDNRPSHSRPDYGGIVNPGNAQATGSGSSANSQSGSQYFNQFAQSGAQSQAQSQGYQPVPCYPCGPNGGSGASSASSAASATSGIVNGVAVASAAASAAAAGSGNGGAGAVSASASSSSSSGNSGGFDSGSNQIPPWYFRNRIAGEDSDSGIYNTDPSDGTNEATIVFSVK